MMNTIGKYALICSAFLLCSLEMFAAFGKGEANCIPQVASNVGAKVYVNKNAGYNSGLGNSATNASWSTKTDFTFYFYADDPAFSNDYTTNYLWDGWYQENTKLSEGDVNDHHMYPGVIRATSSIAWDPTTLKLDAHWVQVIVNSANNANKTVQDPTQNVDLPITYKVTNAKDVSNFEVGNVSSPFASQSTSWSDSTYTWTLSYKPTGIHNKGGLSTNAQLTSIYGGTSRTATATVVEDYTPTFSVSTPTFGSIEAGSNTTCDITPSRDTYASQHGTWTAQITGDANGVFALNSISAEGVCAVTFASQAVGTFSATLQLTCTYTDAAGTPITYTKDVPLSATATPMQNPQLTLNNVASNPGLYTAGSPALYQYPEQYGTVTKTAEFALSYALLDGTPTFSWSGNTSSIFAIQQGTATTNGIGISTLPITISAHANTAVTAETTYTATLTIEGNSAKGTLTQQIQVSVTIQPKKKNTLAWALDIWNANSYVLYSDQKNQPVFKDRNNLTTPIVFSSSQKDLVNYIAIDTAACTLSPVKIADSRNLKAVQAESDEYEGTTLTTTIHVRKHDLVWTYPQTDWARGTGKYLYRNTYYANILSSNSIDAGEGQFTTFEYLDNPAPDFGQTLIANPDGTYGMQTGDLASSGRNVYIKTAVGETDNYAAKSDNIQFVIIKDPIHVPVSLGSVTKFTSGAHKDEWYGLWLNNGNDMYGSTFKVSEYKATWIGYDWVGGKWTGTNTGRTDWTTVAGQGNNDAFALEDGGYVVFRFRGVPLDIRFFMHFQTNTSDGTVKVEESTDGTTWTETVPGSTTATYLSTSGGWKYLWMNGNSRYIRISYTGNNWVVIRNLNIIENNCIRTDFTTNTEDKVHISTTANNELTKNADGTWKSFDFTLRVANWGKNGIQWTTDNPDFELEFTQPTGTGLDEYKEIPAKVRYKGDKYFDQGTLKLFTRDFYSKTATDTLRSLTFTVSAIGTGTPMPQTITNSNKTTTYITGTVGPLRNSKTDLQETYYSYSTTRGDNPHTGLNEQDFTSCFDSDGTALFDYLYIFGETTNHDGSFETYDYWYKTTEGDTLKARGTFPKIITANTETPSNAVTPCYIYKKTNNTYTLEQTIPNMNVADKPIPTFTNDGKYYFSGFCPSASTGYRQSEIGILHFLGSGSSQMDVYLENCTLMSRGKTADGHIPVVADAQSESLNKFVQGSGAVLAFQSTSNKSASPFRPNIHIKGENYLRSSTGTYIKVNVVIKTMTASNNSSPIHVYTTSTKECTVLNIDDIWCNNGTPHTNGALYLRRINDNSPSIDLGNGNTILYFKGGRISLKNAYPVSTNYTTTQAISWRYVEQYGQKLYGMGTDQNGGQVYFQDGTISSVPLTLGTDYADKYRDAISLKCPENTYIDGGTYECSLWACPEPSNLGESPKNSAGSPLTKWEMPVKTTDTATGLVSIDFPGDLLNEDETDTEYYGKTLNYYYQSKGLEYGTQSLSANDTGYVVLMLPAQYTGKEAVSDTEIIPWAFTSPAITPKTAMVDVTLGGNTTVASGANTRTDYLLWTQIDNETKKAGTSSKYTTPVLTDKDIAVSISIADDSYGEILNTDDYSIAKKLYLLLPVQADKWFSMAAPFDISHIYVMNTYPDSELQKETREKALELQGTANMDLAYFVGNGISGMGTGTKDLNAYTTNFWQYGYLQDTLSGAYPKDANAKIINGVATPYYPSYYTQAKGYTTEYRGQNELNHFTGANYDADYYLYHSKNKTWAYDGTNFTTDWEVVTPVTKNIGDKERSVLMQQGEIYALQFPYCPGCDDVNNRSYFDYWTGKFILFEGFGPQTIKGTNAHEEAFSPYEGTNSGVLRGNTTFATMQKVPNANAYFNTSANVFKPGIGEEVVEPTGVFMLANASAPRAISAVHMRTGDITYIDETDQTGTPTISGGKHLLVATDEGSLTLIPTEPQQVYIYSAAGKLIADRYIGEEWQLSLPAGIYMVRGAYDTAKVVIR
ncbi:MAG: hypothetical protein ACI30A_00230 [Paludibacteraceae bacterium]